MSYLWLLILNIRTAILACTAIQGSTMSQAHAWRTLRWALSAVQQRWLQHSSTACHNFQHAAPGSSPVNLKKCQGMPDIKGLAGLGGMGKPGVAIGSGCCRSTGRVSQSVKKLNLQMRW
jgi:hypothetical protein